MKIRQVVLLFPFLLLGMVSCFNYETQFEGPYEDEENIGEEVELPKVLVYVAGGNVYLADRFGRDSIILDNSGTVKVASINNEHSKVIFKPNNENIQIYDIATDRITGAINGTSTAVWFDYHANNETIYFLLSDGFLDTSGPEILANRPIQLKTHSARFGDPWGVTVLENGHFIFSLLTSTFLNDRFVFLSDGTQILEENETTSALTDMRLNHEETVLWSGDEFGTFLHIDFVPSLNSFDTETSARIGVPLTASQGYRVRDNDMEIQTPDFRIVESPGGRITSIDF